MANVKGLQRAYKRIRAIVPKVDSAAAERAIREEIARYGEDPMLVSMLASVIEPRVGTPAALELHSRAAMAAPENTPIVEDYAACQERAGNLAAASAARFSLFNKGLHTTESLLNLAWTLMRTRSTLTSDRVYTARDLYLVAMSQAPRRGGLTATDIADSIVSALSKEKRYQEVAPVMQDAAIFEPASGQALYVLGLKSDVDTLTARRFFDRAVRATGHVKAMLMRAMSCGMGAGSQAEIDEERQRIDRQVDELIARPDLRLDMVNNEGGFPYPFFYLAYHGEDDRPILSKFERLFRQLDPRLTWQAPHVSRPRNPDAPIDVALVGSFDVMSIYLMMLLIAKTLDRQRFRVTIYTYHDFHPSIAATFDGIPHVKLSQVYLEARGQLAEGEHDIILFTDLFMNPRYYFLAYARLARHQALWPGHPDTSGLSSVDYYISTDTMELPDSDRHYAEKLVRFPDLCTIYPTIEPEFDILDLSTFGIGPDSRVYMCSQTLYKMHHDMDRIFASILDRDPAAIVIIFENPLKETTDPLIPRVNRLIDRFGDRFRMLPRFELPRFLGLMRLVHVLLDTVHFSGGNTSFQAFQMGIPVVTLPREFMRGRATYSLYKVMGFTDLVARDEDDYVALAIRVANDPAFRSHCVAEIEAKRHRIFDRMDVVNSFERFFEQVCREDVPADAAVDG